MCTFHVKPTVDHVHFGIKWASLVLGYVPITSAMPCIYLRFFFILPAFERSFPAMSCSRLRNSSLLAQIFGVTLAVNLSLLSLVVCAHLNHHLRPTYKQFPPILSIAPPCFTHFPAAIWFVSDFRLDMAGKANTGLTLVTAVDF